MTTFQRLQQKSEKFTNELMEYSGLDREIVQNVIQYAKSLPKPDSQDIDLNIFTAQMCHTFEMTREYMVTCMFFSIKDERRLNLTMEEFCKCVLTFMTNNLDLKINFAFQVYDVNHDGSLNYVELYQLLKPCIITSASEDIDAEDSLKELIELVVKLCDEDEDRCIDVEEFRTLVKKNVLYVQLLGPTFPPEPALQRFLHRLRGKTPFQVRKDFFHERERSLNTIVRKQCLLNSLYPVKLEIP